MQSKYKIIIAFLTTVLIIALTYSSINNNISTVKPPLVIKGTIDLTTWDFEKNGNVPLDGEWEFSWNQLLGPSDFPSDTSDAITQQTGYLKVPLAWEKTKSSETIKNIGAGTYRVKIKVNKALATYGIKTTNIRMASKMFVNGYNVGNSGNPTMSINNGYISSNAPFVAFFQPQGEYVDLIIQVSNFDFYNGGIIQKIYFGTQKDIIAQQTWLLFLDIVAFACLFITGIYYISVYIGREKERSSLYFGLFTILVAFIVTMSNEKILVQFFNNISYMEALTIKCMAMDVCVAIFCLFIREKDKSFIPLWFLYYMFLILGLDIMLLLGPLLRIYSSYDRIFKINGILQINSILAYFVILAFLLNSIYKKKYGTIEKNDAYLLTVGVILILVYYISGVLYLESVIYDTRYSSAAILLFLIIVSTLLSRQYTKAFSMIEAMSQKLIRVDKLKDEFLITTSHELKTPLHGIINITQSVLEKTRGLISPEQEEGLSFTVAIAQRLSSLINDIIDEQSLKNNSLRMDIKELEVNATVQVVLEILKYMCKGKDLVLSNHIPSGVFYVWADENRFQQIIYNLVGNSLRYTEKGTVTILAESMDKFVKISILDTGIGIAKDLQARIFDSYESFADNNVQDYPATGLGLPISKRLAEYMGGELWLEDSKTGRGSCFSFNLPAVDNIEEYGNNNSKAKRQFNMVKSISTALTSREGQRAEQELAATLKSDQALKKKSVFGILLVDDEVSNIKVLTNIFSGEAYETFTAFNGQQALEVLNENRGVSLVLLDVMMPGISGFEVCKRIRETHSLFELPILMLTVRSTPEDIEAGLNAGANDFLAKPFDARELRARVATLIHLSSSVKKAQDSEIAFLQAQVNPHFLFNALNSIAALCRKQPQEAEKLTLDFAAYLRGSFDFKNLETLTTINKELEHVKHYLSIEKVRFGKRLEVDYDIDENINILIPPLILQPLVENAVKHGIASISRGGKVNVYVKSQDQGILFCVADNGKGMNVERIKEVLSGDVLSVNIGLTNINKRLKSIYAVALKIETSEDQGTSVSFLLPNKLN